MDPLDPSLSYYSLDHHEQNQHQEIDLSAYDSLAETAIQDPGKNGESSRKRKGEVDEGKIKKTRQSQSCDACRARKVRCDRPPPGTVGPESDLPTKDVCSHCQHLKLPCTFQYVPKKRGPPNQYVKKLRGDDVGDTSTEPSPPRSYNQHLLDLPSAQAPPSQLQIFPTELPRYEVTVPYSSTSTYYAPDTLPNQDGSVSGMLADRNNLGSGSLLNQAEVLGTAVSEGDVKPAWEPNIVPPTSGIVPSQSPTDLRQNQSVVHPTSPVRTRPPPTFDLPSYPSYPHNPKNPLDNLLPRGLLYHVIDLFFDYIYCLTPCIHKPSFMRDLHSKREERPDEEEWIALVLTIVATTILQMPRSFVPLPRREVKKLGGRCSLIARTFLHKDFDEITTNRFVIYYLNIFATVLLDLRGVSVSLSGANWALMLRARLHEEETYSHLNPIEAEMRRRVFWLQFGAEKSIEILGNSPSFVNEELCAGVRLPSQIDDEYLTEDGYLPQPAGGKDPVMSGFYYISKLFRITAQIIDKRARDKSRQPTGLMLQMRVNEVNVLYDQVMSLMDNCPTSLRLDLDSGGTSSAFSEDWDTHASDEVRSVFQDPKTIKADVKDVYLVQQANIYVTQQMTRYVALQYRDDLLTLQEAEISLQIENQASTRTRRRSQSASQKKMDFERALLSETEKEQVASDLLIILRKIPIQTIAVNSFPLVLKIRFVASTLLDALNTDVTGQGNSPDEVKAITRIKRIQHHLLDFLRLMSEIESLYSMDEDEIVTAT